jgi:membrane associated rhomboid family serine protease
MTPITSGYFRLPPVVKNLLIVNAIIFAAQSLLRLNAPLVDFGALVFDASKGFGWFLANAYRLVTYMFLHADMGHIFANMFTLWMFGRILEYDLGSRRFLAFYMICGVGAGLVQLLFNYVSFNFFGGPALSFTIGASGAVLGVLMGFGMMYPNNIIMMLIPPIPMKAKWFVVIYAALTLWLGVRGTGGPIAHFAHLGGMLWGMLLLLYWRRKKR